MLAQDELNSVKTLGIVVLRPHQTSAVGRLRSAINEFGGALLCDQVGMGKTFVALALSEVAPVAVVAPAVLRDMWIRAAESTARTIQFVSTESLSRRHRTFGLDPHATSNGGLLIVDEAHHFRNPSTKRYDALAELAANRDVLLLSATPIHNRRRDLGALLAIFLGSRAEELTAAEHARVVVRREGTFPGEYGLPAIEPPQFRELSHDDDVPRLLLALPPPLPPREAGDGGVLLTQSLVRQWASSDAAIHRALVRRLQRAVALTAALESGTYPSMSELSAWAAGDDCVQLAFSEMVAQRSELTDHLVATVRSHADAVSALLQRIKLRPGRDIETANTIRSIRRDHGGLSVVAFSQYADTVDALFKLLAPDGHVASLSGRGAHVFGGRISRADAIARFAPEAAGASRPHWSEAVTLLLTTDLLSEGVNLQDAAVVVHLDMPWTPARMEQRLGRVARMGSRHECVFSYVVRPPASAETLIGVERVLREKMAASGIVVDQFQSLTCLADDLGPDEINSPRIAEETRAILEGWLKAAEFTCLTNSPVSATLCGEFNGFLALCLIGARHQLVAGDDNGISLEPMRILRLMRLRDFRESANDLGRVSSAGELITRHFEGLALTDARHGAQSTTSPSHRSALHRIGTITSRSRPHERARIASLAARARSSLLSRMGAHAERRLEILASASMTDENWMHRVAELGHSGAIQPQTVDVKAILVLRGDKKL
ncbi:MAG: helicase-related protein [Gemmatimonadaceae bacterium]